MWLAGWSTFFRAASFSLSLLSAAAMALGFAEAEIVVVDEVDFAELALVFMRLRSGADTVVDNFF